MSHAKFAKSAKFLVGGENASEGLVSSEALGKKTLGVEVLNGHRSFFLARPSLRARASQSSPLRPLRSLRLKNFISNRRRVAGSRVVQGQDVSCPYGVCAAAKGYT